MKSLITNMIIMFGFLNSSYLLGAEAKGNPTYHETRKRFCDQKENTSCHKNNSNVADDQLKDFKK